jgi:hypothetical protein
VLGDQRALGTGHDELAAAADRLGDGGRGVLVAALRGEHDDQVEAAGPAGSFGPGQATNGTGHHGSSTARSSRESGPAATTARGRLPRIVSVARRTPASARTRLASYPRTGLGEVAQRDVGARERGLVVEQAVVEHVAPPQSRLAGLVDSSIGMSSRTG